MPELDRTPKLHDCHPLRKFGPLGKPAPRIAGFHPSDGLTGTQKTALSVSCVTDNSKTLCDTQFKSQTVALLLFLPSHLWSEGDADQ